ncbi:MAG: hypothetical protein IPM49_10155 [Flavobacteriales bacterium]|nr:hypothetical protein [Flavobacteriales bacterium]
MSAWIDQIFSAAEANGEGVVRRQKSDVDGMGLFQELIREVRRRNFHLLEIGDQYVIICNTNAIITHC